MKTENGRKKLSPEERLQEAARLEERRRRLDAIRSEAERMMDDAEDPQNRYEAYRQYVVTNAELGNAFYGEVPLSKDADAVSFEEFARWEAERPAREAEAVAREAAVNERAAASATEDRAQAKARARELRASNPGNSQPQPKGEDVGQAFVIPAHVRVLRRLQKAWKALFD